MLMLVGLGTSSIGRVHHALPMKTANVQAAIIAV